MVLPETGLKVGYVWRIWSEFRWLARTRLLATTAMPHRRGSGLAGYLPVGFPGRLVPYPVHEWRPITLPDVLFHDREGFTAISSGAWSRSVKSGPVRVAAGWRCCRVTAEAGAALRARGVGQ
jgi:hypothetical protein